MILEQGNLKIDMDNSTTLISFKDKDEKYSIYTTDIGIDLFKNLSKFIWSNAESFTEKELEGYLNDARMLVGKYLYDDEECKSLARKLLQVSLGISNAVDFIKMS